MKARNTSRPFRIQTRSKTRARKSIDDDFAPSVTPSTAGSDFPRWYHYYPTKDKTWWPKRNVPSPEPEDPYLKIRQYKPLADPSYRLRRSTGGSTAEEVRAATTKLKMKTRMGAVNKSGKSTQTQTIEKQRLLERPRKSNLKKGRKTSTGRRIPAHQAKALKMQVDNCHAGTATKTKPTTIRFEVDNLARTRTGVHKLGTANRPMTIDQLPATPISPNSIRWPTYRLEGTINESGIYSGVSVPIDEASDAKKRQSSASSSRSAGRKAFEEIHGRNGRRLGSIAQPLTPMSPDTPIESRDMTERTALFREKCLEHSQQGAATLSESHLRRFSENLEATRRLSTGVAPSKRFSTDVAAVEATTTKKRRLSLVEREEAQVNFDGLRFLLNHIQDVPNALTLEDVGPLFAYLQTNIQAFAEEHFSFTLTHEQQQAWPLRKLASTYFPLLLVTQFIADGSQYTWQRFFTNSQSRSALVFGVIGEWLKHRVFNHTCFGMSASQIEKLEDMDREYLHYDAFLRSKKRAKMVMDMLEEFSSNGTKANELANNLHGACDKLAEELMTVLTSLLPMSIFSFHEKSKSFEEDKGSEAQAHRTLISMHLSKLIKDAAILHRAIRVLGRDGTIVRIAPSATKNEEYYETAPFVIVNQGMLDDTKHHGFEAGSKEEGTIKIKMTCFPRVEAFVPHGPDYEEMCKAEREIRSAVDFEKGIEGVDTLENDVEKSSDDIDANDDDERQDGFNWNDHADKIFPALPEYLIWQQEKKYGKGNAWARGAYVSVYPRIAAHQVYCEWATPDEVTVDSESGDDGVEGSEFESKPRSYERTRKASKELRRIDEMSETPVPKEERITLRAAVSHARSEIGPWKYAVEDQMRMVWNAFCQWEGVLETVGIMGLMAWFGYSLLQNGKAMDLARMVRLLGRKDTWIRNIEKVHGKSLRIEAVSLRVVGRGLEIFEKGLGKMRKEIKIGKTLAENVVVEKGREKVSVRSVFGKGMWAPTASVHGVVPGH